MEASILGKRIRAYRRAADLTQDELGHAVGLTGNTISRLETGLVQDIKSQSICRLADALDVTTDSLLGRESEPIRFYG